MTTNDLSTGYHRKCEDRLAALAGKKVTVT